MADEADIANENAEMQLQRLLASERHRKAQRFTARSDGSCYNDCGDPAIEGAPFCSKDCAEDVERRMKLNGLAGAYAIAEGT